MASRLILFRIRAHRKSCFTIYQSISLDSRNFFKRNSHSLVNSSSKGNLSNLGNLRYMDLNAGGKWNNALVPVNLKQGIQYRTLSNDAQMTSPIEGEKTNDPIPTETLEENEQIYMQSFIQNMHKFQVMSASQLEQEVHYLESLTRPQSWDESFAAAVYPLMESCARLNSVKGAKLAERILARCIVESSSSHHSKDSEGIKSFDRDYHQINTENLSNFDLSFVEAMDDEKPLPSSEMYNIAIDAWGKSQARGSYGAKRAEQILNLMIAEYIQNLNQRKSAIIQFQQMQNEEESSVNENNSFFSNQVSNSIPADLPKLAAKPDAMNYSAVMSAWARSGQNDAAEQAQRIFDQMIPQNQFSLDLSVEPDTVCFNTIMSAWSHSRNKDSITKVENLFQTLFELYKETKKPTLHPTKYTYSIILDAYARVLSSPNALKSSEIERIIQRAETLQYEMQKSFKTDPNSPSRPDTITFNSLLNVFSRAKKPERAEQFLDHMIMMQAEAHAYGDFELVVKPNVRSYNTIINGWACVGSKESGAQAERILQRIEGDNGGLKPNIISYNSVINAYVKSGTDDAAQNAMRILDEMLAANLDAILEKKTRKLQQEQQPLLEMYESGALQQPNIPKPNTVTFGTVIHAWSVSNHPKASQYAETLLNQMETLHQSGNFPKLVPNKRCFQGVISCFRNINNGEKAEEILFRLHESGTKGEGIDNRFMKSNKPDTYLYNIVLSAWVKDTSKPDQKAKRAQAFLQWMEASYNKSKGDESIRPDIDSYNIVIETCASSGQVESPPTTASESNDNMNSSVQKEAFFIAIETFKALCERALEYEKHQERKSKRKRQKSKIKHRRIAPNSKTYHQMLKAITSLLPAHHPDGITLARKLFLECCRDGFLNDEILNEFKKSVSVDIYTSCIMSILDPSATSSDELDFDKIGTKDLPPACFSNS